MTKRYLEILFCSGCPYYHADHDRLSGESFRVCAKAGKSLSDEGPTPPAWCPLPVLVAIDDKMWGDGHFFDVLIPLIKDAKARGIL